MSRIELLVGALMFFGSATVLAWSSTVALFVVPLAGGIWCTATMIVRDIRQVMADLADLDDE